MVLTKNYIKEHLQQASLETNQMPINSRLNRWWSSHTMKHDIVMKVSELLLADEILSEGRQAKTRPSDPNFTQC